jgi:ethanolamine ammonia-lyase small subunit
MPEPPARDPWAAARAVTPACIGLPRVGASLATEALLDFRLAHARARDAVYAELDETPLCEDLAAIGWRGPVLVLASAAADRQEYKLRPDLGRRLAAADASRLTCGKAVDLAVVVADGLSARAVQTHAAPLLAALAPALSAAGRTVAPPVIVRHGRVAIGDEIALRLGAGAVLVLIGERPGLSAPDSMGAYITWKPVPATTDADRNCISNIRPEGTPPRDAAARIALLLARMRRLGVSGVGLKDESDRLEVPDAESGRRTFIAGSAQHQITSSG